MKEFHLQIVTPDGIAFDGQVESLLVRGETGDVEILAGHTDLFASLGTGRTKIKAGGESKFASSSGGFVSVSGGDVKLVATTFEFQGDIDLDRAIAAKEIAEARIAAAKTDREIDLAKAKLQRALNRIRVKEL